MKLTRIFSPADAKALRAKLRGHACKYETWPTIQVTPAGPRTEDQCEFDRDLCYLTDLANAVMDEYRHNTRAVTATTAINDLMRLVNHCTTSELDLVDLEWGDEPRSRKARKAAYWLDMQDYLSEASR